MATIGFVLSSEQFPTPELVKLGEAADRAGFGAIWTSDHFQPWQDNQGHSSHAWITLAAVGQRTAHVLMGTGVTCPTYRYRPAIVAEGFASLGLLYPGRVFLGVGTGEALNERASGGGWGSYRERGDRLIEAVKLIRRLWTGDWVSHDGRYYPIEQARLYDVPSQPVPIYFAAAGPKSMRLAGIHGDGLITSAENALQPELRDAFREGARSAGKDPEAMPIVVEQMVSVSGPSEAAQDAERWRFLPKAFESYVTDPDPRSIQRRAEADVPIDQVVAKFTVGEDPGIHIQALQKLIDAGVTHIFVHSAQQDQRKVINFYGRHVLPEVEAVPQHVGSNGSKP